MAPYALITAFNLRDMSRRLNAVINVYGLL
jgi:hypothetical protein